MSVSIGGEPFAEKPPVLARPVGVYGAAVGSAMGLSGICLLVSSVFAIGDDARDVIVLAVVGLVCLLSGLVTARRPFAAGSMRSVPTLSAAVCAYLTVAFVSAVVYLMTGTFERLDDALYESVAGVSTSALSLVAVPESVGDGVLIWRSATQWLGGFGAIALAVGIMPFMGGSRELADPRGGLRSRRAFSQRPMPAMRRVGKIYGLITGLVVVGFLLAGMGIRDSVAHTFSSVSTGGFSTHADSIAHFDSVLIELLMIVVMGGAGSSVALVWMVYRGHFHGARRAIEIRVYCAVIVAATLWIWWLQRDGFDTAWTGLRQSLFTVVSLVTTTGHRVADWGTWHPGASTLLLFLLVIGGMAGSVAGGLRWFRVIGIVQFLWRELQRQLHPRSVRTVKIGTAKISEPSLDRMHAQLVYLMAASTVAALVLALFGEEVVQAVTLALSAISTTGPGFDGQATVSSAATLSRPERGLLMPIMLTGRVFLYPAFIFAGAGLSSASGAMRAATRERQKRG